MEILEEQGVLTVRDMLSVLGLDLETDTGYEALRGLIDRIHVHLKNSGKILVNRTKQGPNAAEYVTHEYSEDIELLSREVILHRQEHSMTVVPMVPGKGPVLVPSPFQTKTNWNDRQLRFYAGVTGSRFPYGTPLSEIISYIWSNKGPDEAQKSAEFVWAQLNIILKEESSIIIDLEKLLPLTGEPRLALVPVNERTLPIIKKLQR